MEYSYKLDSDNKTIVVRTTGIVNSKEAAAMGLIIRLKANELNFRIIFDHRYSTNKVTITEAYYWFSDYYVSFNRNLRFIPSAYITNTDDCDFFRFFETTCSNKSIPIRMFLDEQSAMEWIESYGISNRNY